MYVSQYLESKKNEGLVIWIIVMSIKEAQNFFINSGSGLEQPD